MKDHEIAKLVSDVRDCAVAYRNSPFLREHLGELLVPALRELSQAKYAALMLDLLAARVKGEDETSIADQMDGYQQPSTWVPHHSPAFVVSQALEELKQVREELRITDQLLVERDRLLHAVPACPVHGAGCVPHALEWVSKQTRTLTDAECAAIYHQLDNRVDSSALDDVFMDGQAAALGRKMVDCVTAALQQSSSGITAGAENASQVVDFGAAGPNRTGDLLITNQDKNTPETSHNQDVTRKTAPTQPAEVVPTESIGCEGVTAGLERYIDDHIDWLDRLATAADYEAAREPYKDAARELLTRFYEELRCACDDTSRNAPWLTLAHTLCADAGVPSGHIADRLEGLRKVLESRS